MSTATTTGVVGVPPRGAAEVMHDAKGCDMAPTQAPAPAKGVETAPTPAPAPEPTPEPGSVVPAPAPRGLLTRQTPTRPNPEPVPKVTLNVPPVMPETSERSEARWAKLERVDTTAEVSVARHEQTATVLGEPERQTTVHSEVVPSSRDSGVTQPIGPRSPTPPAAALGELVNAMQQQMRRVAKMTQVLERVASPGKSQTVRGRHERFGAGPMFSPRDPNYPASPGLDDNDTENAIVTAVKTAETEASLTNTEQGVNGPGAISRNAAFALFGESPVSGFFNKTSNETAHETADSFVDVGVLTSSQGAAGVGSFGRATGARLHAAGADQALPPDVRLALKSGSARRRQNIRPFRESESSLKENELNDPLVVNDVVVQFLAYREIGGGDIGDASSSSYGDVSSRGAYLSEDGGGQAEDKGQIGEMIDEEIATHGGDPWLAQTKSKKPSDFASVRFAFNFFDFPLTTSTVCGLTKETKVGEPRLLVPATSGGHESRNAGDAWFRFRVDSGVGNGSGDGGDENATNIATDDESNGPHRRDSFIKYLHSGTPVMVDVFHGDSLLQKGVCALDIRSLLRKGMDTTDTLVEAPMYDHSVTNGFEFEIAARRKLAAGVSGLNAHTENGRKQPQIGALLVRLINVGRRGGDSSYAQTAGDATKPSSGGPVRSKEIKALPEAGGDVLGTLGVTNGVTQARETLREQELRKLARELRLTEIRNGNAGTSTDLGKDIKPPGSPGSSPTKQSDTTVDHAVRSKVLESLAAARLRRKREVVLQKLRECSSVTKITIRPSFGELVFVEFPFRNGNFHNDAVFDIRCDDPELVLVTSAAERNALRRSCGSGKTGDPTSPGSASHENPNDSGTDESRRFDGSRLFLAAGESTVVAFKFQSFAQCNDASLLLDQSSLRLKPRTVSVTFVDDAENSGTEFSQTVSVVVKPTAAVVTRTFRFHAGELDFWKKKLGVPNRTTTPVAVRVSDPQVAASVDGGEIALRVKCGSAETTAANTQTFFVRVYGDQFLSTLLATWRVVLHVTPKTHIACSVGQTSRGIGLVKNFDSRREIRVVAFSSAPDELVVLPNEFVLPPSSTQCSYPGSTKDIPASGVAEMQIVFRPLRPGRRQHVIHLVDLETGALVHARVVVAEARAPRVSRSFDVSAHMGKQCHKKIQYRNPYPTPRVFYLKSTHPGLLKFRVGVLDLAPAGSVGDTAPMGLTFAPGEVWEKARNGFGNFGNDDTNNNVASADEQNNPNNQRNDSNRDPTNPAPIAVLVFINDESDATEECFEVRVVTI